MSWRRTKILGITLLALGLLGGLAFATARTQQESRSQLEERFALRGALGAQFASSYVQSIVRVERRRAEHVLAGARVSEREFRGVLEMLDFRAGVFLDSRGRLLHAWPRIPEPERENLAGRYEHLRVALTGRVGISNVVSSAAEGLPIVAFAVPFTSVSGRRVFSGAFGVDGTPLAAYLKTGLPFAGGELFLVDSSGALVIDDRSGARRVTKLESVDAPLAAELAGGVNRGEYSRDGKARFFASHAVSGTEWSIIVSVPTNQLFAPIGGIKGALPWILFAAFALAAAAAAFLVWRLAEHRHELAASNRRLARSNDELRDLDRLKDEFVALVSHELRTPLTSILGYISALKRGRAGVVPLEQRQLLDVAERNAHRLLTLIGDLLLAAKADAGKLKLEQEPLELSTLIRQAVESARPHAESGDVDLKLSEARAVSLVADRARLAQVLDNLISNAIKFTPPGGAVQVSLSADRSRAVLEVRDDGIGIPRSEQAQLFQRFFRASTATSREISGTGLGLATVKTIVELHHGTIECRSDEAAGTTFVVTLPLGLADEAAA